MEDVRSSNRPRGTALSFTVVVLAAALGCGGRAIGTRDGAAGGDAGQDVPAPPPDANDGGITDTVDASAPDGGARCRLGAWPAQACVDTTCGHTCGDVCADLAVDVANCGACGVACAAQAVCADGVCQPAPRVLVPEVPGCVALDLALEGGQLTWADFGHGTIRRMATGGGDVTTLASGIALASMSAFSTSGSTDEIQYPSPAPILVRDGTVYFIAADVRPYSATIQEQSCDANGTCVPVGLPRQVLVGGAGTAIQSVAPGAAPATLLPASLAPATWTTSLDYAGALKSKPAINAIALSPDGKLLYFAAGGSFYVIPSTGARSSADVTFLGPTKGQLAMPTAMVTDGRYLVFPAPYADEWLYAYDISNPCAGIGCPPRVGGSHVALLADTIVIRDGWVYWGNGATLRRADLSKPFPAAAGTASETAATTSSFNGLTGFDVTPRYAYLGDGFDGHIERVPLTFGDAPASGASRRLARQQKLPSSLVSDGTHVFWTTQDCDVKVVVDPDQPAK